MATDIWDVILFTPGAPLIDISKGDVPGNYARFQVSSKHLTLASAYFRRMLKDCWIPINDCEPNILLIILNLIHGRSRQVPWKLSLPELTDIAVATDFFQCHEAIEVFARIWINNLEPLLSSSFSEDTKRWMMIAWVFKSNDILQETEEIAIQQGRGPFQTINLPIPKSIKDRIDEARQQHMETLQVMIAVRLERLLTSSSAEQKSCCNPECDAAYLGLILRTLTKNKISYAAASIPSHSNKPHSPLFAVSFGSLSPTSIESMVKNWNFKSPPCGSSRCANEATPFGGDVAYKARHLPTLLQDSENSS
ncbi:hypothetical protein N7453_003031 [Penicillium expansum]|nr:hypothetical protein N7453_003031 [Penicillium expansum]